MGDGHEESAGIDLGFLRFFSGGPWSVLEEAASCQIGAVPTGGGPTRPASSWTVAGTWSIHGMGLESVSGAASDRPGGAGEASAAAAATPAGTKASQLIPLHLKYAPRTSLAILETFSDGDVK